jgi:hypothetical protein
MMFDARVLPYYYYYYYYMVYSAMSGPRALPMATDKIGSFENIL